MVNGRSTGWRRKLFRSLWSGLGNVVILLHVDAEP
jgi:hypothetical protein